MSHYLKSLPEEKYRKLKKSLLKHGFSFPFFVWRDKNKLYTLDGHQRDRALKRLKKQGYEIPPLPVDYIEAKSEKEAREKILLLSSQYGEMTEESLEDFLKVSDLDIEDLIETVDLPGIDLEELLKDSAAKATRFEVIATCPSKKDALGLLRRLKREGYKARSLTS